MALNTLASGQPDAKATRMRETLSTTRATTLSSRRHRGFKFGRCQSGCLRDDLLDAPQQPVGRSLLNQAHLIGVG